MFRASTLNESRDPKSIANQLMVNSNAFVAATMPALFIVAVTLVVYLRGVTSNARLLAWFGPTATLSIVVPFMAFVAWRARRKGTRSTFETAMVIGIALAGVMVGLAGAILHVPESAPRQAMMIQTFVVAIASSAQIAFGPSRKNFVAFQIPANGLNALSIVLGLNAVPIILAPMAILYLVMLTGTHYFTLNAMTTALVAKARGDELVEELQRRSSHDLLTGVANRGQFLEQLTKALAAARRTGTLVAVCFIDLDHFKSVNDTHGHATGDAVLVEMAGRLQEEVRLYDLVARQGGDEFTVLLVSPESEADALSVAERICRRLGEQFVIGDLQLDLTGSVGLAVNDDFEADADVLIRNADLALYRAKALGRNRAEFLSVRDRPMGPDRSTANVNSLVMQSNPV